MATFGLKTLVVVRGYIILFLLVCLFGKLLISVSLFMDVDIVVVTEVGKINYLVTSRSCKDG